MEKKVLLKNLVDTGHNIRKEIISNVVCSDEGQFPIGELWDANKTVNTIVNGASLAFDTFKETEDKLHQVDERLDQVYTKTEVDDTVSQIESGVSDIEQRLEELENNPQSSGPNHVFLTADEYAAIQEYDQNTIYFVWDEEQKAWVFPGTFPVTLS